jgi:hypothetical protein
MTYTIGAGKSFNMVLSHPDDSDPATWDQQNTLSDMRREFQGVGQPVRVYGFCWYCLPINEFPGLRGLSDSLKKPSNGH